MRRRHFIAGAAAPLVGCARPRPIGGGFAGIAHERGHLVRAGASWAAPSTARRTRVLIAGAGVAGLAAARALRLRGIEDFDMLELEDGAGGNSRAAMVGGISCPLGAHYLPLPGDDAGEVQDLLEELGLRRRVSGRWVVDERHLCHSPQERLFFNAQWQEGLLPVEGVDRATLAQYQEFAALVEHARQAEKWPLPLSRASPGPLAQTLMATDFSAYLAQHGLTDAYLRWYLDYCCRDDYGAGIDTVSAWAGMHYFASRHGFRAGSQDAGEREAVFTWPQGNHWLTERLAAPLGARLSPGWVVLRIAEGKHGVEVDAFNPATQATQRWLAQHCIVALPLLVAARVVENAPELLRRVAARTLYAPWLVANIHIDAALHDRPGAAPCWDNVLYGDAPAVGGLGYVDAMHQSLSPVPGATVLTHYRALGDLRNGRRLLLEAPWEYWRDLILAELGGAHPDLAAKTTRIEITRYGHAMAVPTPVRTNAPDPWPLCNRRHRGGKAEPAVFSTGRLAFAHGDWAGYSIFEEAFTLGHLAAGQV